MTFGPEFKLNSRPVYCSRLYGSIYNDFSSELTVLIYILWSPPRQRMESFWGLPNSWFHRFVLVPVALTQSAPAMVIVDANQCVPRKLGKPLQCTFCSRSCRFLKKSEKIRKSEKSGHFIVDANQCVPKKLGKTLHCTFCSRSCQSNRVKRVHF